ncbi:hypothetical protein FB451DRAFT_292369 [Mycena latifolia]|nr:hypothetical protein FB451DRAFT_292369 [Mycena latifolia]
MAFTGYQLCLVGGLGVWAGLTRCVYHVARRCQACSTRVRRFLRLPRNYLHPAPTPSGRGLHSIRDDHTVSCCTAPILLTPAMPS